MAEERYTTISGASDFSDKNELKQFVPTLFIGLGGTGKDILMRFRKKLNDEYGMPNEKFAKFLVLDTDDQTDVPNEENEEAFRPVGLRPHEGEFIKCTIEPNAFRDIVSKLRDEHDRRYIDWLHPQIEQLVEPTELSQGQRKLAGIARALVVKPRIVCLDEPAAGLDTRESEELGGRLRRLADEGQAMLLVDHDMGLVLSVCDRIVVLDEGSVIATGPPADIRDDRRVIAAYLGERATAGGAS